MYAAYCMLHIIIAAFSTIDLLSNCMPITTFLQMIQCMGTFV